MAYIVTVALQRFFEFGHLRDWREASFSARVLSETEWDAGAGQLAAARREALQPLSIAQHARIIRIDYEKFRRLADDETDVFEPGSLRYVDEVKPLRDAFIAEFVKALTPAGVVGGGHSSWAVKQPVRVMMSRRSIGAALEELLTFFRTEAPPGLFPADLGFEARVREIATRARYVVRDRARTHPRLRLILSTLREWARTFAVHTGSSPPAQQLAIAELHNGGKIESDRRPSAIADACRGWIPRHSASHRPRRMLESEPAARGPELVDHRRFHQRRPTFQQSLRRSAGRTVGNLFFLGLRRQPRVRVAVAASLA